MGLERWRAVGAKRVRDVIRSMFDCLQRDQGIGSWRIGVWRFGIGEVEAG